jgi:hypothetical protein
MFEANVEGQSSNTRGAYAAAQSPTEKLSDGPLAPVPGVERTEQNEVKREINPNTE